jgi:hypothetical protein
LIPLLTHITPQGGSRPETATTAADWKFLSKQEEQAKKKAAIKIQRGYQGYAYPPTKKLQAASDLPAVGKPVKKIATGDAKYMLDKVGSHA